MTNTNNPFHYTSKLSNVEFKPNARNNGHQYMKNNNDDDMKDTSENKQKVLNLLSSVISRANDNKKYAKFVVNDKDSFPEDEAIESPITESSSSIYTDVTNLFDTTINRAESIIQSKENTIESSALIDKEPASSEWTYLSQPCITTTALAHSLWTSILNPMMEINKNIIVIDATCGNGQDSLALAKILSPSKENNHLLLCIDVQKSAIENTSNKLRQYFGAEYDNHVKMICGSHAPLLSIFDNLINEENAVGLICYNLGYLPGDKTKQIKTKIGSTIESLKYAATLIDINGILSVVTYPQTNREEAIAVLAFLEGLALLNKKEGDDNYWVDFIHEKLKDEDEYVYDLVHDALMCVFDTIGGVDGGKKKNVWRVFEHRPLGRAMSPSLVTAVRIQ